MALSKVATEKMSKSTTIVRHGSRNDEIAPMMSCGFMACICQKHGVIGGQSNAMEYNGHQQCYGLYGVASMRIRAAYLHENDRRR